MQLDFHYYATFCAAFLSGYSYDEALQIGYASQFVDCCTATLLQKLHAPKAAATTQSQSELAACRTDLLGLQDITRIWTSFHFLPFDLYAECEKRSLLYKSKYRLICDTNSDLLVDTITRAKDEGIPGIGIAMHILADTWAHRYFAGTPSLVINNTDFHFTEILKTADGASERPIFFRHNPVAPDDPDKGLYTNSAYQENENSIMNLGHGRAGHFPDYSFARYRYLPAWGAYQAVEKNNPEEYYYAFCQMIYAMQYMREEIPKFEKNSYAFSIAAPYEEEIRNILEKRQLDACADWMGFAKKICGREIEAFDVKKYQQDYLQASVPEDSFLGQFFVSAVRQKSMVNNRIFKSGNLLAGISKDTVKGVIPDYIKLQKFFAKGETKS